MAFTNVPVPTFGPKGFIAPSEADILAGELEDINSAFGGGLNPALDTPQGQLGSSLAAQIGNVNDTFVYYTNQVDPALNEGRMQDAIGRIYFLERSPGTYTAVQCVCNGRDGIVIPTGAKALAEDGNTYICTLGGTISGGTITLPFSCIAIGPIVCAANTVNVIYQAVNGWDSINNPTDGVIGSNVESRNAYEQRRALSTAWNSAGNLPAVLGAVLSVAGVIDAFVTDNDTGSPVTVGTVTIAANSIYVCVAGGAGADIAEAIWTRKMPGCAMNGGTTVTVYDDSYTPPVAYPITYQTAIDLEILVAVQIANTAMVPADAVAQIQNAIIAASAGSDGGPRTRIGTKVYASRFYAPVAALGSWAQIISLLVGSANNPAAEITAAISGTTLTVSATASGSISTGQSIVDFTGHVLAGTTIISGSGSSWVVSLSQTVASETMYCSAVADFDETVEYDQIPVFSAANIAVLLV